MARDDFSAKVKRKLEQRVGSRCSKPDCLALTRGPNSSNQGTASVGVAAHITAASEGGPRYDESLTPEQRRSFDNGIWLCQTCSRIVDVDEHRFPASLLTAWKQDSEQRALASLGKASHEVESVLRNELKGMRERFVDASLEFRDRAFQTLEGFGATFPTSGLSPNEGTVSFVWRTGVQAVDLMLLDLPGGIWSDRVSVSLTNSARLRLRVFDRNGDRFEDETSSFGVEMTLFCAVRWLDSEISLWVNGKEEATIQLPSALSTLPPRGLLGIDLDGKLSAENMRRGYIVDNRPGLNLERHGVWEGNQLSHINVLIIAVSDEELATVAEQSLAHFERIAGDANETLRLFVREFSKMQAALEEWSDSVESKEFLASRVRNLLVDGEPNVLAVREILSQNDYSTPLEFMCSKSVSMPAHLMEGLVFSWQSPNENKENLVPLNLEEFLEEKNLCVGGIWFSNSDVISIVSRALERGRLSSAESGAIAGNIRVGEEVFGLANFRLIAQVVLAALEPLAANATNILNE